MLCDDHMGFIEGEIEVLRKYPDFEIIGKAISGEECIKLINDGLHPDVILLDISMPNGLSGYDVAKYIQQKKLSIKVIAVSMLDDINAIKAMIRFGAMGFVYKGDSFIGLDTIIRTVYHGGEYYPKEIDFTKAQIEKLKNTHIAWLENIHPQEIKVLELIAKDKAHKEVSKELAISSSLIAKRLRSLGEKTGAPKSSIGLIQFFKSVGLIK